MTLYNKTTIELTYGAKDFVVKLPASSTAGTRGIGVEVNGIGRVGLAQNWSTVQSDIEAGKIEME